MKTRTKNFYQKSWLPDARKKIDTLHNEFSNKIPFVSVFFRPAELHNLASILAQAQYKGVDNPVLIDQLYDFLESAEIDFEALDAHIEQLYLDGVSNAVYIITDTVEKDIIGKVDENVKKEINQAISDFIRLLRKKYNDTIDKIKDALVKSQQVKHSIFARFIHILAALLLIGLLYLLYYFDIIYWDWKYSLHLFLIFYIRGFLIDHQRVLRSKAV